MFANHATCGFQHLSLVTSIVRVRQNLSAGRLQLVNKKRGNLELRVVSRSYLQAPKVLSLAGLLAAGMLLGARFMRSEDCRMQCVKQRTFGKDGRRMKK